MHPNLYTVNLTMYIYRLTTLKDMCGKICTRYFRILYDYCTKCNEYIFYISPFYKSIILAEGDYAHLANLSILPFKYIPELSEKYDGVALSLNIKHLKQVISSKKTNDVRTKKTS